MSGYSHLDAIWLASGKHITIKCILFFPLIGKSFQN